MSNIVENGRRVFILGGFQYTAPQKIGAGHRARYAEEQMQLALESPEAEHILKLSDQYETKDLYQAALKAFTTGHPHKATLAILRSALTPAEGSPSVEEGYDQAEDKEVQAVVDFFTVSLGGKTATAQSKTGGGKSSVVKTKAGR
jgi:hypothetical protein